MVARASVPALGARIRADLDVAKRHRRARVSVPVPAGADQRQGIVGWLGRGSGGDGPEESDYGSEWDEVTNGQSI